MRKIVAYDTTVMTYGTEISNPSTFYEDLDKFNISWTTIDRKEEKLIKNMCESAVTDFARELRSVAAAFAVISTDSHMYRNPFTKFLVYRRGIAWRWVEILLEMYINEGRYIWERRARKEEVRDFLNKRVVTHPIMRYLEDRIDECIENHYLGEEMVDMAVDSYTEILRCNWENKIERLKGEVIMHVF